MLRPRSRGSSSTKPTTRTSGCSRSSRRRLRPARPAPTSSVRRCAERPATTWNARAKARSPKREAPIEHGADDRVDHVDVEREVPERVRERDEPDRDDLRGDDRDDHAHRVGRGGVAPDAAVEPERDEERVPGGEDHGQRDGDDVPLVVGARAVDAEEEGDPERGGDEREVDEHLDEPLPVDDERPADARGAVRAPLDLADEARELDEQGEAEEDADGRDPGVVEDGVREARRAERRRHEREQDERTALREAAVDDPVRGVVAAALADRPSLEQPHDRDERRVEDRHREHEDRQEQRRDRRPGDVPAREQAEAGEDEAEHLAARVAHEDRRGPAGADVEGEEAEAGERERQREHEHEVVLVHGGGVDREVAGGDRGERRGEAVHVVEQVERVRHPDEPEQPDRDREDVVADDLDGEAAREHDHGGGELGAELRERRQRADVVDEAGDEQDRAAREDAAELGAPRQRRRSRAPAAPRRRGRGRSRSRRRPASRGRASGPRSGRRRGGADGVGGSPR